MTRRCFVCLLFVAVLAFPSVSRAELLFDTTITLFGTGLGAVNSLVTVHDPGGPGNRNGTESGCFNQNGSLSPCLGGLEGGDNTAINQVLTFNTDSNFDAEFAAVPALCSTVTVSRGVQFVKGSTNDANDTMHVIQFQGTARIPELASLSLLGSGLVVLGIIARRRMLRK